MKKRIFAVLIELDQIILPMIGSKQKHLQDEIARMHAVKARKAKKHMLVGDNWEDRSLDSLSDESGVEEEEGKTKQSDIPASRYEQ